MCHVIDCVSCDVSSDAEKETEAAASVWTKFEDDDNLYKFAWQENEEGGEVRYARAGGGGGGGGGGLGVYIFFSCRIIYGIMLLTLL